MHRHPERFYINHFVISRRPFDVCVKSNTLPTCRYTRFFFMSENEGAENAERRERITQKCCALRPKWENFYRPESRQSPPAGRHATSARHFQK